MTHALPPSEAIFCFRHCSTWGETNLLTSPPSTEISRTRVAEMNRNFSAGVRKIDSTSGYRLRFMPASWNSYSKSDTTRRPRITTLALCWRAKFMSSPENPITVTLLYSLSTLFAIATRSSSVKNGCLPRLSATATISSSNMPAARRTRSWWPSVIGSKVPGYTALMFIASPFQQLVGHRARAAAAPYHPRRRKRGRPRRFDVDHGACSQARNQRGQHLRQGVRAKRRIEEHHVVRSVVRAP